MYDVIHLPINKKKIEALYVIIQNKLKTNNMTYNNKTIIFALATASASAVKLRTMNVWDDIGDAFEDAGDWIVGAADDTADIVVAMWNEDQGLEDALYNAFPSWKTDGEKCNDNAC